MSGRGCGPNRNNCTALGSGHDGDTKMRNLLKKTIGDYQYILESADLASNHQRTTEYLVNHTHKTVAFGNDIETA